MTTRILRSITLAAALLLSANNAFSAPTVEAGFSPEGSALQLVLRTIGEARQNIRLMGYSFTSPEVVKALTTAKRNGVDVKVVLDENGNRSKASVAAMNTLVNAGIPVRTNRHYKIQHDKVIIVDGVTTETGSFNYSRSAAQSNSENALVVHNMPELAQTYLTHWQSRWNMGTDWTSSY